MLNTNALQLVKNHPLASQELRDILVLPETTIEKKIIASLARAYEKMGKHFPSLELSSDLDALYSDTDSLIRGLVFTMGELASQHSLLTLEKEGLSLQRMTLKSQDRTHKAWLKAFITVDRDLTPAFQRCRELRFLALQIAGERIEAALKQAHQQ